MPKRPGSVTMRRALAAGRPGIWVWRVRWGFMAAILPAAPYQHPYIGEAARQEQERRGPGMEGRHVGAGSRQAQRDEVRQRAHRQAEAAHVHAPGEALPV